MALYTIADLHLSTFEQTDKSMEVFGKAWDGYMVRLKNNWTKLVSAEDTVVVPGDVSWALSLDEALVRDDERFEKVVTLVETYFREGGLHLQLNHVSREELLDAKAHPEDHASLRVRVSGFSAYFTTLAPTIQDDVIARTEH